MADNDKLKNGNDGIAPDAFVEYSKKDGDESDKMIEFLCTIGKLKSLDRRGWVLKERNIEKPETVAGHMYRMAIMALLFEDDDLQFDVNKLMKLSVLHDMSESIVGDITPFDNISEQTKHEREYRAMNQLTALLPAKTGQKLFDMFEEYEKRESPEAILVKEFDRFDVMLQAYQYEKQEFRKSNRVVRFEEFFTIALEHIKNPKLRSMVERIVEDRKEFFAKISDNNNNTNAATTSTSSSSP